MSNTSGTAPAIDFPRWVRHIEQRLDTAAERTARLDATVQAARAELLQVRQTVEQIERRQRRTVWQAAAAVSAAAPLLDALLRNVVP